MYTTCYAASVMHLWHALEVCSCFRHTCRIMFSIAALENHSMSCFLSPNQCVMVTTWGTMSLFEYLPPQTVRYQTKRYMMHGNRKPAATSFKLSNLQKPHTMHAYMSVMRSVPVHILVSTYSNENAVPTWFGGGGCSCTALLLKPVDCSLLTVAC